VFGVDRAIGADVGLVSDSAGDAFVEVGAEQAGAENGSGHRVGVDEVGSLDGTDPCDLFGPRVLVVGSGSLMHCTELTSAGARSFTWMQASVMIARPAMLGSSRSQ